MFRDTRIMPNSAYDSTRSLFGRIDDLHVRHPLSQFGIREQPRLGQADPGGEGGPVPNGGLHVQGVGRRRPPIHEGLHSELGVAIAGPAPRRPDGDLGTCEVASDECALGREPRPMHGRAGTKRFREEAIRP